MDDVFGEVLKVEQLFTFLFQLQTLAAQRLREQAGQIGDRQKSEQIADEPEAQAVCRGGRRVGTRNPAAVGEHGQPAQKQQAEGGDAKSGAPGKQDTADNDHQQVERDEVAVLQ